MAAKIRVKRSTGSSAPGSLSDGELAYAEAAGGHGRLYIGHASSVKAIGGLGLMPRLLYSDYTSRGYFTSGTQDLATFTIPANTLKTDGDRLRFRSNIVTAANDNYKAAGAKFNGTSLISFGSNFNNERFVVEGEIVRNGTSEARANTTWVAVFSYSYSFSECVDIGSLDFTAAIVIKMDANGSANLDVSQRSFTIEYWPAP